jgi:hypothetical protein
MHMKQYVPKGGDKTCLGLACPPPSSKSSGNLRSNQGVT